VTSTMHRFRVLLIGAGGLSAQSLRLLRIAIVLLICLSTAGDASAQVSPEEHAKHHPDQATAPSQSKSKGGGMMGGGGMGGKGGGMMGGGGMGGKGGGMMGGGGMGGKGGGMMGGGGMGGKGGGMMGGGGMGGMMEKMGAPKPKEMYPRLMDLPDLPMEERAKIEAEAHQRMLDGTELLTTGFDQLTASAPGSDFAGMQTATATIREGLARFESGLAAHRAIAEGKAPRNVAMQWFRKEMNLLPPATASQGLQWFGMSGFHTAVMALLVMFAGGMIWMYFFKMRRASELMQKLATATATADNTGGAALSAQTATGLADRSVPRANVAAKPAAATTAAVGQAVPDCCGDSSVTCADEEVATGNAEISQGLLRVGKRKLCRLRVTQIYQETEDVKTFRLVACHGGALPFSYLPGQFLSLTLPVAEKPIRRSYTISSSPTQGYYCEITVKREDKGAGSRFLHDQLQEGDTLEAQAPSGKFIFTGEESESVVLIGGGVGITPMMSITRALTDMGWPGEIHLIAACRDPDHFIFEGELRQLQQRHSNLHVHGAMSRMQEESPEYRRGRLTKELLTEWVPDIAEQRIHLCGAPAMMDATKEMLVELGVSADQIYTENFGSQHKPRARKTQQEQIPAELPAGTGPQSTGIVRFRRSGETANFEPDETVLEAAERVGVDIENSCRVGSCGLCAVKLVSGEVTMESEDGLDPDEKSAGMILACMAKSTGNVVVEA